MIEINVIDELLALSEKEARKILSETNVYKAKYFKSNVNGAEYYIKCLQKTKFGNLYMFSGDDNPTFILPKTFINSWRSKPLSYQDLVNLKQSRAYNKIRRYDADQFSNYLKTIAQQFYDEKYVSVRKRNSSEIELVIHFPEIKITNSVEFEHTVRDLYFVMLFYKDQEYSSTREDEWRLRLTSGMRGTMEDKEILTNYTHSHLSDGSFGRYSTSSGWCYGETDIKRIYSDLLRGKLYGNLNSFLASLEGYLSWESIEGSPYRKIENTIKYVNGLDRASIPWSASYERLTKQVLSENIDLDWNYIMENGKYKCKLEQSSIDSIDDILTRKNPEHCFIVREGFSYVARSDSRGFNKKDYEGRNTGLYFKGEQVVTKVIETMTNESSNNAEKKIHRSTLSQIVDIINNKLTEFVTNKYCER